MSSDWGYRGITNRPYVDPIYTIKTKTPEKAIKLYIRLYDKEPNFLELEQFMKSYDPYASYACIK